MSVNELGTEGYRKELQGELERLLTSQSTNPSEYKEERIARLTARLGDKDESHTILD